MRKGLWIFMIVLSCAAASQAATIWDTRAEFDADFSNTSTAFRSGTLESGTSGHNYIEYTGSTEFLSETQTFEYNFTFGSDGGSGGALWFGSATNAQWLFFFDAGVDNLRIFNGRNLTVPSGGSVVEDRAASFVSGGTFVLKVVHSNGTGDNKSLDIDILDTNGVSVLTSGAFIYNYTFAGNESWGITNYGPAAPEVTNSLSVVPEPATMSVLSLFGICCVIRRSKRA